MNAQSQQSEPSVFIYCDYQNVKLNTRNRAEDLLRFAKSQGNIVVQKVYANWRKEREVAENDLYELDYDCIDVPTTTKNSVDNKLIKDCQQDVSKISSNLAQDIVIILTKDGDFTKLVKDLKDKGKKTFIFSNSEQVSKKLREYANEVHSLNELPHLMDNDERQREAEKQPISYRDAVQCLIEAIKQTQSRGKRVDFSRINNLMLRNQNFPNYCGVSSIRKSDGTSFRSFKKFIAAVAQEGLIQVQTVGKVKILSLISDQPLKNSTNTL